MPAKPVITAAQAASFRARFDRAAAHWRAYSDLADEAARTLGVAVGDRGWDLVMEAIVDAGSGLDVSACATLAEMGIAVAPPTRAKPGPKPRHPDEQVRAIVKLRREGLAERKIADRLGITQSYVSHVLCGKIRSDVSGIGRAARRGGRRGSE